MARDLTRVLLRRGGLLPANGGVLPTGSTIGPSMRPAQPSGCQTRLVTAAAAPPRARWQVVLLAALTVVLGLLLPAAPASAATLPATETRVGVFHPAGTVAVGVHECISAGQRPVRGPSQLQIVVGNCVAAEAGSAVKPSFIASADGVVVPTSRSRLVGGFDDAGLPSVPTRSPGTQYTLPDGSLVRVMEPSGQAPLRASFTDSLRNAINPFTGKQPQPPPGVSGAAWRQLMRNLTHVELGP